MVERLAGRAVRRVVIGAERRTIRRIVIRTAVIRRATVGRIRRIRRAVR